MGTCSSTPNTSCLKRTVYRDIAFGPANMGLSKTRSTAACVDPRTLRGLPTICWKNRRCPLRRTKRRGIAGVIAMEPRCRARQPSASLDPGGREELTSANSTARAATVVVLVSHSMEEIAKKRRPHRCPSDSHVLAARRARSSPTATGADDRERSTCRRSRVAMARDKGIAINPLILHRWS